MINITKYDRLKTSRRTLKILAILLWIIGGVMLIRKASELVLEAHALQSTSPWIWLAIASGIFLGSLKAKYLFRKACKKNLTKVCPF